VKNILGAYNILLHVVHIITIFEKPAENHLNDRT
jgi:hypothetical protein